MTQYLEDFSFLFQNTRQTSALLEQHRQLINSNPPPLSKMQTLQNAHALDIFPGRYPSPPSSPQQRPLTHTFSDPLALTIQQNRLLDRSLSEHADNLMLSSSLSSAASDSPLQSPTSAAQQLNSSRYKTEMCRPFEESGYCKYAEKCQFAHGAAEQRNLYRHPKYKTELCRTFHTTSFCPYGARCNFIHSEDEAKLNQINNLKQQASALSPVAGSRPQRLEIGTFDAGSVANMPRTSTTSLGSAGDSPASSITESPTSSPTWDDLVTHSPTHQQQFQHRTLTSSASFPFADMTSQKFAQFHSNEIRALSAMLKAQNLDQNTDVFGMPPSPPDSLDGEVALPTGPLPSYATSHYLTSNLHNDIITNIYNSECQGAR